MFRSFVDKFVLNNLHSEVRKLSHRLDTLIYHQTADQLVYDIAKFVVFNQVPGDYLEFGVNKGDTLLQTYRWHDFHWDEYRRHLERHSIDYDAAMNENRRYFGFDSFEGLPEVASADTPIHFAAGVYNAPLEAFRENVANSGLDSKRVIPISGWFDKSLTEALKEQYKLSAAASIYIDCDLYESSLPVFQFITNLVQDGTTIIIDDFYRYKGDPTKGIQRAFNEWRSDHSSIRVHELSRCSANRIAYVCHLS